MSTFKETQYLTPVIRWGAMAFAVVMISIGILGAVKGLSEDGWVSLVVSLLVGPFVVGLILLMRLDLKLSSTGISHKLFPLEWKERQIPISEIESVKVHKLPKFGGYGGFGKRRRLLRKQVAYIMNRNCGLTVRLKNGRTKVFSIEHEKKLRAFIQAHYSHLSA